MSGIIKIDKSSLETSITSLSTNTKEVDSNVSSISSTLASIPSHSDFPSLSTKASMISRSLSNIGLDLNHVSKNIKTYLDVINEIDAEGFDVTLAEAEKFFDTTSDDNSSSVANNVTNWSTSSTASLAATSAVSGASNYSYSYTSSPSGTVVHTDSSSNSTFTSSTLSSSDYDVAAGGKYNYEGIEEYLEDVEGTTVTLPEGLGSVHTYMGWQCITATGSKQYKLREAAGMVFDEEGFAKIGDRYVVATTTTFGNVGDFIDVYQEDGTIIKCVIGDIKSQGDAGCNKWGHNNGTCVVEFVVDKSKWYQNGSGAHANPGTASCHPEWNQNIDKIVNKGNFFELIKTDAAKFDKTFSTTSEASEYFVDIANNGLNSSSKFETASTTSEAYSSDFVTWCADKAGFVEKGVIPEYSTATEGVEWFKENATFETTEYSPKSGDIAFYDTDGDGTADYSAIIVSTSGNNFTTVEGSLTDSVRKATYTTNNSKIVGYGVPDYAMLLLAKEEDEREAN